MTRQLLIFGLSALVAASSAAARFADLKCDDSARLSRMLTQDIGAERRALALRGPETALEVWVEPRNGDWTLVQRYANGTSCIVAMGQHWETLPPAPA